MHLPAKTAIWKKASDPGDPTGDVWGGGGRLGGGVVAMKQRWVQRGGNRGRGSRLHLTKFTRIRDVSHIDTSSQSRPNYWPLYLLRNKSFSVEGTGWGREWGEGVVTTGL